jgi:hypothetical protein
MGHNVVFFIKKNKNRETAKKKVTVAFDRINGK